MVSREFGIAAVMVALAGPCVAGTDTRTSGFDYDPATGFLVKEIIEPGDPILCQVTTYTPDAFGNRKSATTRNCNQSTYGMGAYTEAAAPTGDAAFTARTSSTVYDPQGRFATSVTNALGQTETRAFDPRFGGMISLTGPNNLTTSWVSDSFGRKASETRADGTSTTWTYTRCVTFFSPDNIPFGNCNPGGVPWWGGTYSVAVASTGAPTSTTYYDILNRAFHVEAQGFDGTLVNKHTVFDNLGRTSQVSRPYFSTQAPVWTTFHYDILGRVKQVDEPTVNGSTARTRTDYNGLVTTVTVSNADSGSGMPGGVTQVKTTTKNSQGQVVKVIRQ
jgi:hypothetical protein